jgi:hypothetical protein
MRWLDLWPFPWLYGAVSLRVLVAAALVLLLLAFFDPGQLRPRRRR